MTQYANTKITGNLGEITAQQYLQQKGYQISAVNFKRKWGELDIVATKKSKFIFVEVKSIHKKNNFAPEDQVTPKKQRQLVKMAQIYLSESKIPLSHPHQIDIIAIEFNYENQVREIRHHENAIEDTC